MMSFRHIYHAAVLCCIFLLAGIVCRSQQRPYYTQYIQNNFIINPALAGIENYWDVKLSHRRQWQGLEGAPVTTYFTMQGPLHKSDYARENALTIHAQEDNPRGAAYWNSYQATDPHAGVGLTILNDRTGPINRFSLSAALAWHAPLGAKTSIAGGFAAGFQSLRLETGKLYFGDTYSIDPVVASTNYVNRLKPDLTAGVWIYGAKGFVGLSAQQILPLPIGFYDGKLSGDSISLIKGKLVPHLFFQTGYRLLLSPDVNFLPSLTLKFIQPLKPSADLNVKLQYRDVIWAGGSYRFGDGYATMLGLNISSTFNMGYSYDFISGGLNRISNGTHEILVGILLGNNNSDWCPRHVW